MQTAQMNSPRFNDQTTARLPGTLDDFRLVHDNYATSGNFSAKSMRPVWITALVIAAVAGIAFGVNAYSERDDAKITTVALAPDPTVPTASSVPATGNQALATEAPAAKDSPVTDPLSPLTKSTESNSMPMAGHGNNHSSESLNPVKAKSSVAAKSSSVSSKRVAPTPAAAANEIAPPPQEATPSAPAVPAPTIIEEKPVVPPPAPKVEPTEPPKL